MPRSCAAPRSQAFLAEQLADAKERGVLFSVHLKTTMMRVSDPIIFGHAVRAYFADLFDEHGDALKSAGVNPNDGVGAMLRAIEALPDEQRDGDRAGDRCRVRERPAARDGRFRPRHHQPSRPQRRDHRRLDAGGDPLLGADVESAGASCRTRSS